MKKRFMFFALFFCSILFAFGQSVYHISGIAYGNGRFVAVAGSLWNNQPSGRIAHSVDGISWTAVTANIGFGGHRITSIVYGGGRFVAVGEGGRIAISTDGISWLAVTNSTFGNDEAIGSVAYGGGRFVAVSQSGRIAHSADGISWTQSSNSAFAGRANLSVGGVTYNDGNRRFIVRGLEGDNWMNMEIVMAHSADGINWSPLSNSTFGANTSVNDISYGNGRFVAIIYNRTNYQFSTMVSTDGANWMPQTNVPSIVFYWEEHLFQIVYGGGRFVAVGRGGAAGSRWEVRLHSSDGVNWTRVRDDIFPMDAGPEIDGFSSVVYGNGRFIAVGGIIALSTDGINWMAINTSVFR
ncbi:MAG: hypothetical protein FWG66_09835 [Spirochaetes bacterium]|nr:hypothetical protein [Spirochaetota bacterium]